MSNPSDHEMELANFVCKFGKQDLVDRLEDFFLPGLFSGHTRKWGDTSYHLKDLAFEQSIIDNNSHYIIYGRLVKNMVLKREQVLENGRLRRDRAKMASAPSAVFVLVLETHRLIYIPETHYAPRIDELAHTIETVVRKFVSELSKQHTKRRSKSKSTEAAEISKSDLQRLFPRPSIRTTPLASTESLSTFINRYSILKTLQIKVLETNNEVDWGTFFSTVRQSGQDLDSSQTEVRYENRKDGLDTEVAAAQVAEVASQGNHTISMLGKDRAGEELKGNNHEMRLRIPITLSTTIPEDAVTALKKYSALIRNKTINVATATADTLTRLEGIYNRWRDKSDSEQQ